MQIGAHANYVPVPVPEELSAGERAILVQVMSEVAATLAAALVGAGPINADHTEGQDVDQRTTDLLASLTVREQAVAARIARGLEIKEIARELEMSYESAKKHIARIKSKLGVRNQLEVAILLNGGRPQAPPDQPYGDVRGGDTAPAWRGHLRYNMRTSRHGRAPSAVRHAAPRLNTSPDRPCVPLTGWGAQGRRSTRWPPLCQAGTCARSYTDTIDAQVESPRGG